jgi:hypothetical protein
MINASVLVVKASKDINYKAKINSSVVYLAYVNDVKRSCSPISKKDIIAHQYRAKLILKKNRIICKKDLYIGQLNKLIFDFGNIAIERDGKLIKETTDYIKIRNENGKIEKIYKHENQR